MTNHDQITEGRQITFDEALRHHVLTSIISKVILVDGRKMVGRIYLRESAKEWNVHVFNYPGLSNTTPPKDVPFKSEQIRNLETLLPARR